MLTVNLELSKKLKEDGYPQLASCWYMLYANEEDMKETYDLELDSFKPSEANTDDPDIAAPTADEILAKLESPIRVLEEEYFLSIEKIDDTFTVDYVMGGETVFFLHEGKARQIEKSLADAGAKMWLYLKEHGVLTTGKEKA